jgi:hypothetical protein
MLPTITISSRTPIELPIIIFFLRLNAIVKFPLQILNFFLFINANKREKRRQAVITTRDFSLFQKSADLVLELAKPL